MKNTTVKLLWCASALLAASAAHAQSSVTFYGLLDLSMDYTHAGNQNTVRMLSGAQTGSRFGIRGTEDIGGGNHVNFVLENGFNLANGQMSDPTAIFNRQAWVGMSGNWGEVRVGRQNSPLYVPLEGKFDATGTSTIASGFNSLATLSVRASNGIFYQTPTFAGLSGQVLVGLRDSSTRPQSGVNNYHITATYLNGPVDIDAGYQSVDNATNSSTLRALFAGGSYDFGTIKAYVGYNNARQSDDSVNKNVYTVSGSYRFNPFAAMSLVYTSLNDRTPAANNAQHIGLMGQYYVSKRTWFYVSAAVLLNRGRSTYALNGSTTAGVPVPYPGADVEGLQIGMQTRF
jgi:predicted porin